MWPICRAWFTYNRPGFLSDPKIYLSDQGTAHSDSTFIIWACSHLQKLLGPTLITLFQCTECSDRFWLPHFVKSISHMIVCIYLHISVIVAIIQREHTFKRLSDDYTETNWVALHMGRSLSRSISISVEWVVDRSHLLFYAVYDPNLILSGLRASDPCRRQDDSRYPSPVKKNTYSCIQIFVCFNAQPKPRKIRDWYCI